MCRLKKTFLYEKQISQPNYTQHRTQLDCVCPLTLLVAPLFWFGSQMFTWFHGVRWFLRFLNSRAKTLAHTCIPMARNQTYIYVRQWTNLLCGEDAARLIEIYSLSQINLSCIARLVIFLCCALRFAL